MLCRVSVKYRYSQREKRPPPMRTEPVTLQIRIREALGSSAGRHTGYPVVFVGFFGPLMQILQL
jgi:hypothetical protein